MSSCPGRTLAQMSPMDEDSAVVRHLRLLAVRLPQAGLKRRWGWLRWAWTASLVAPRTQEWVQPDRGPYQVRRWP